MDNNVRFRNHISIVVEKLGVLGGIVVAYLIANANTIADLVSLGMPSENLVSLFLAGVAILMVLLFVVGYNVAVWCARGFHWWMGVSWSNATPCSKEKTSSV